ncbi:hypothetical protein RFM41_01815 [Mesorhizobium sp. VK25A]|uniref:Uncharacterized protein n=1 Tax=Mesorhizobium vachelliae TaxID=3072309 RepID=A0ABU5A1D7_9HYPH|nr:MULTISPECIES: hypothetical protein [unclassified Mesorhizobium]MDX8530472.1 hypothetical protein [Mesorhizobium sp. VK25D]MDX8542449.1 hypothetical protein [Mesorhizobium sp. VK25A]
MVGELKVPAISAGGTALVTVDDLQHIPMKAGLIRPEPLHQLGQPFICVSGARPETHSGNVAGIDIWEAACALGMSAKTLDKVHGHHQVDFQKNAAEI